MHLLIKKHVNKNHGHVNGQKQQQKQHVHNILAHQKQKKQVYVNQYQILHKQNMIYVHLQVNNVYQQNLHL